MRILFLEDDGMTGLAPYVRSLGHQPVVLRSGAYDDWHANECGDPGSRGTGVVADADAMTLLDAAIALRPNAVSLALLARTAGATRWWRTISARCAASRWWPIRRPRSCWPTTSCAPSSFYAHGIGVTEAVPANDLEQATAAAARLGYPVVIKRNDGYAGIGMRLCHDQAQLERYYRRQPGPMLVEHFIEGIELSVDVLRWQGRSRALAVVHKGATDHDLRRHPIYRLRQAPAPIAPRHHAQALEIACRAIGPARHRRCRRMRNDPRSATRPAGARGQSAHRGHHAPEQRLSRHRCPPLPGRHLALGRFDIDRLQAQPGYAFAEIPVRAALAPQALAQLEAMPAVRFIKPINWVPDLGISASLTVADRHAAGLLAQLATIDRFAPLEPALSALAADSRQIAPTIFELTFPRRP